MIAALVIPATVLLLIVGYIAACEWQMGRPR